MSTSAAGTASAAIDGRSILLYHTAAMLIVALLAVGLLAVHQVMRVFLTPMLWAVLLGTVLFPLKRIVRDFLNESLSDLEKSGQSLAVAILLGPLRLYWRLCQAMMQHIGSYEGLKVVAAYGILKALTTDHVLFAIIHMTADVYEFVDSVVLFFTHRWMLPLAVLYFVLYVLWIFFSVQGGDGAVNKKLARLVSLPIWLFVLANVCAFFGGSILRVLIFAAVGSLLALVSAGWIGEGPKPKPGSESEEEQTDAEKKDKKVEEEEVTETVEPVAQQQEPPAQDRDSSSLKLLRTMLGLCGLLWLAKHDVALLLIAIPAITALLAQVGMKIGLYDMAANTIGSLFDRIKTPLERLVEISVAGSLRRTVVLLFSSDRMLLNRLRAAVDGLATLAVLVGGLAAAAALLVVVGAQLYAEAAHLTRLTASLVSQRPNLFATALNYTEGALDGNDVEKYVDQAYEHGRVWLTGRVRALVDPSDPHKADLLEAQVDKMLSNLRALWEELNQKAQLDDERRAGRATTAVTAGSLSLSARLFSGADVVTLKDELLVVVRDNIDTVLSVARSIWSLAASNAWLLSASLSVVLGAVVDFGLDVVNFFVEVIVFVSVVYYLLAGSGADWAPLEWAGRAAAALFGGSAQDGSGSGGGGTQVDVTAALQRAISDVFVLTAQMGLFYFSYIYFLHALFGLNIIFVPSILGGLFAAIPLVSPWTVCLVGCVELWLVRDETAAAILFLLAALAPMAFADGVFYRQVQGCHPYATGLAVIGGLYWLGLQGAVVGPIILCTLLVPITLYSKSIKK